MPYVNIKGKGKELVGGGGYSIAKNDELIPYGDRLYGPYSSVEEAHEEIVGFLDVTKQYNGIGSQYIPMGFTVGIIEGEKVADYSYQGMRPESGYTVEHLKPKTDIVQVLEKALSDENDNEIKSALLDFLKNQNVVVLNQN